MFSKTWGQRLHRRGLKMFKATINEDIFPGETLVFHIFL